MSQWLLDSKVPNNMFLWSTGLYTPKHTASHPVRLDSSLTPLREPHILYLQGFYLGEFRRGGGDGKVSVSNEILQICYITRDRALSCYCVLLIRRIRHIITYCLLWMYVWHGLLLHNSTHMRYSFIHSLNLLFYVTPWPSAQSPAKTLHPLSYWNSSWLFVAVWVSWKQLWG